MIHKNKLSMKLSCILLSMTLIFSVTGCSKDKSNTNSATPTPVPTQESQEAASKPLSKTAFKLNTVINIQLYDNKDEAIIDEAFALCDTYEQLLSRTIATSEVYQLNESGTTPFTVTDNVLEVFQKGLEYSKISDGAFDISVQPLTSLWNFGSVDQHVPAKEEIEQAVANIGYEDITLEGNTITLGHDNMGIDLGAIAKGFIADKIKDFLLSKGVNSAIINLGGNVLCVGAKPDGTKFNIGIQKPYEDRNETIAVMELSDVSVVSSGIYERYFVEDGVSYHHILNPKTGYPYDNDLVAVTIISKTSVDGDALSTTTFALGLEKGLELIDSMEDTYAVFITKDDELHYSKGFKENIVVKE